MNLKNVVDFFKGEGKEPYERESFENEKDSSKREADVYEPRGETEEGNLTRIGLRECLAEIWDASPVLVLMMIVLFALLVTLGVRIAGRLSERSDKAEPSIQQVEMTQKAVSGEEMVLDSNLLPQEAEESGGLSARNVYFAGIEDSVFFGEGRIALDNLAENKDFLMRYEVYDKDFDKKIFETGLIPSGQRVFFDPYSVLKAGTYHLMFVAIPYMEQNGEYLALTTGGNEVTIELK